MTGGDWKEPRSPAKREAYLNAQGLALHWRATKPNEPLQLAVQRGSDSFEVSGDNYTATVTAAYEDCRERGWI